MIDNMVILLGKEQGDDDAKKEYCEVQIDSTEDAMKELGHTINDLTTFIDDAKTGVATLTDEMKAVAEATEQRKEENADFTELMASNTAAKDLIGLAKNRLNKFYNPKLYKPPPKRELSEQDRIAVNMGGTAPPTPAPGGIAGTGVTILAQVSTHVQNIVAPPPPPEAVKAYAK